LFCVFCLSLCFCFVVFCDYYLFVVALEAPRVRLVCYKSEIHQVTKLEYFQWAPPPESPEKTHIIFIYSRFFTLKICRGRSRKNMLLDLPSNNMFLGPPPRSPNKMLRCLYMFFVFAKLPKASGNT